MAHGYKRTYISSAYLNILKGYSKEWKIPSYKIADIIYKNNITIYDKTKIYQLLKKYRYIR